MLIRTNKLSPLQKTSLLLGISIILLLIIRMIFSTIMPYADDTEARYGEIGRIMMETQNWVTPQFDYNVPFWAKPPMSTWLAAISFQLLGVNEFAGRFPSFVLSLLTILLVGKWALKMERFKFLVFSFILLTTPVFLIHAGVVSTDTELNFCVVIAMISFWKKLQGGSKWWGYLFFVGLGLGFLAKGPLILVLTGPPLFVWICQQKQWKNVWSKIPWVLGLPLMLLIAIPWYILAERATPGFLDYFIIGEHYKRFMDPGWGGDKYGSAHKQRRGMIWVFLSLAMLPWVEYVIYKMVKLGKTILSDSWAVFLLCWLFWVPVFFTLSTNNLYTYVLPCTIPCALLICHWMSVDTISKWVRGMLVIPILLTLGTLVFIANYSKIEAVLACDKPLGEKYLEYQQANPLENIPYFVWKSRTFSSQFYTRGKSRELSTIDDFKTTFEQGTPFFVELRTHEMDSTPLLPYVKYFKRIPVNARHALYLVTPNQEEGLTNFN